MLSAAASIGMIMLWDVDLGLSHVDKYLYSNEEYIQVSSCILKCLILLISK
jgi:26S proteasome regulatory subunit N1